MAQKNSDGIVSLIFGILSLVFLWAPFLGIVFAIVALIISKSGKENQYRKTGRILGIIGLVLGVLRLIYLAYVIFALFF